MLPSASVLAVLRRESLARTPAPKSMAVLADPVFSSNDARVRASVRPPGGVGGDSLAARARVPQRQPPWSRWPTSPAVQPRRSRSFEANRTLATSGELSQYRIVHFATHGLVDSKQPELSGLVLSLVGQAGRPQDGFLRLHDIYNLRLNAQLVVLSAGQTALGKDVRGEGLIGLTRGFLYAGAPRVVASLWQVDDAAPAQLMRAQLEMMRKPHWQSPHFWGGFVLQGDWR